MNRPARPEGWMSRRTPVWEAPAEILDLMGDVSGNDLNGWGEAEDRPATMVMWADPRRLAHGRVQVAMTEEFIAHPKLASLLRMSDRHEPAPIAEIVEERTPTAWTEALTEEATSGEAPVELVGITRVDRSWFFEGRTDSRSAAATWAVVLGVAMDHAELATAPEHTSAMEVHRQYNRGTAAARALADWIRRRGHWAEGHGGPGAGPMLMIPAALAAGFGELGKHGSIINRHYGSSFRLACVLTDLPLEPTDADEFGADRFCENCRVCTDACPPDAIAPTKRLVRGSTKWAVDFDRCLPYFAASYGCGICIAVCPWSAPGQAPTLAERMERRAGGRRQAT